MRDWQKIDWKIASSDANLTRSDAREAVSMRSALLTAAVLVIALAEADAQTRPYFTPEKAALACKARAGQQIAQDYGISASPSKPFDISETEEGWRIDGIYATDEAEQRRIDVACEVSGDGVEVTLSLSEKTSDSVE